MHLCFATPWGTSWIPLCYVFYMLQTNIHFLMHYYSWSFVCVTFHVITWLLSSIVKIISFMPMFRVLWSQHSMLYIVLIKIVLVHVTSKIIVLLSLTYSRTSMSLAWGCLIRLKRIYNFWCSMLVYKPFALCFVYTSWHFYAFSGTNQLTRCHSVSSLLSAVFVFLEK
jgi:hypothetical protein